jgi:Glycosyltransferase
MFCLKRWAPPVQLWQRGVAGVPDVIEDGVHGLIVPERDAGALAAAIARLITDRALAERLGAAARKRIVNELTWENTAARYEAAFATALRGNVSL